MGSVQGRLILLTPFRPVRLLKVTVFQDHPVDTLSAINTFPHPEVFRFMKDLFVDHHAAASAAF